jgi:hypothetical protein
LQPRELFGGFRDEFGDTDQSDVFADASLDEAVTVPAFPNTEKLDLARVLVHRLPRLLRLQ